MARTDLKKLFWKILIMTCKHKIQSEEGTSYCMLAEESAKKLIKIEKMISKWIPLLEKASEQSGICFNLLEDFKEIRREG